jgi:MFS family permease
VTDTTWFYVLRFVIGAAEAGTAPGVMLYLSQWVPDSQRGRFNSLYWVSVPIAFVAAGPLSGLIMTLFHGVAGCSGWQWLFAIEGALTVLVAPLIVFGLANDIGDAKWLTDDEKRVAQDAVAALAKTAGAHTYKDALRKPETLLACLAYFCLLIGYYGIAFWLPQLIKQAGDLRHHDDRLAVGFALARRRSRSRLRRTVFRCPGRRGAVRTIAILMTAIGFAMSAYFSASVPLSLFGLTMAAVGILAASTVFWANLARIYIGGAAAVGFATINSIGNLGGFVSPYMLGLITDATGSTVLGMYVIAASVAISGVLMSVCFKKSDA